MKKLKNSLIKKINDILYKCLINNLDSYGNVIEELPITDILSVIEQNIIDNKYIELIKDIEFNYFEIHYKHINKKSFDGIVEISVLKNNDVKEYKLLMGSKFEGIGYCNCSPNDENYNEKYKCCGIECDWCKPTMTVLGQRLLGMSEFLGTQKILWENEEKYLRKYPINKGRIKNKLEYEVLSKIPLREHEYVNFN